MVAAGHYLAAQAAFQILEAGGNAVDAILEVRDEHGRLFDFLEFIKEVDLNRLNRRMLQTLAHCAKHRRSNAKAVTL